MASLQSSLFTPSFSFFSDDFLKNTKNITQITSPNLLILCLFSETVCGFLLWCVGDFVLQLCLFTHKKKEGGGKGGGGNGKTSVLLHVKNRSA